MREKLLHSRGHAAFSAILKYSVHKKWKKSALFRARKHFAINVILRGFSGWRHFVIEEKEKETLAEEFEKIRLLTKSILIFSNYLHNQKAKAQRNLVASRFRNRKQILKFLRAWTSFIDRRIHARKLIKKLRENRQKRSALVILSEWNLISARNKLLREKRDKLRGKRKLRILRWAWGWLLRNRLATEKQKEEKRKSAAVSFLAWSHFVKQNHKFRTLLFRALEKFNRQKSRACFREWQLMTSWSLQLQASEHATALGAPVAALEAAVAEAEKRKAEAVAWVQGYENERLELLEHVKNSVKRTPIWSKGFLEAELQWRILHNPPERTPQPRAGQTAVGLLSGDPAAVPLGGSFLEGEELPLAVVLFGGYDGGEWFGDVHVLSAGKGWELCTPEVVEGCQLAPPRSEHCACAIGGRQVAVFGGFDGSNELGDVNLLTISEDGRRCWWEQPHQGSGFRPPPTSHASCCLLPGGRQLAVFGGYRSGSGLLNELWLLDLHWWEWSQPEVFGDVPPPRRGHVMSAVGGYTLIIHGGFDGVKNLDDIYALDLRRMQWQQLPPKGTPPTARRGHSLVPLGNHLLVFGGFDGETYLNDVWTLDFEGGVWKKWEISGGEFGVSARGGWNRTGVLEEEGAVNNWAASRLGTRGVRERGAFAEGRSLQSAVFDGERIVIIGGVDQHTALNEVLLLENVAVEEGRALHSRHLSSLSENHGLRNQCAELAETSAELARQLATVRQAARQLDSALKIEMEKRKEAINAQKIVMGKLHRAREEGEQFRGDIERLESDLGNQAKFLDIAEQKIVEANQDLERTRAELADQEIKHKQILAKTSQESSLENKKLQSEMSQEIVKRKSLEEELEKSKGVVRGLESENLKLGNKCREMGMKLEEVEVKVQERVVEAVRSEQQKVQQLVVQLEEEKQKAKVLQIDLEEIAKKKQENLQHVNGLQGQVALLTSQVRKSGEQKEEATQLIENYRQERDAAIRAQKQAEALKHEALEYSKAMERRCREEIALLERRLEQSESKRWGLEAKCASLEDEKRVSERIPRNERADVIWEALLEPSVL